MPKIEYNEVGVVSLVQQQKDGRIAQIGITEAQSNMLQLFLSKLSEDSALILMSEEYDMILKSQVCKKCKNILNK